MIYEYDGTFEGFESAVFAAFRDPEAQLSCGDMQNPSFFGTVRVSTDASHASRLEAGLDRIAHQLPSEVYAAWLTREDGIDDALLGTIHIGFDKLRDPFAYRQDERCRKSAAAAQRVWNETHRFLEFVRFAALPGPVYVSDIEPDYDILPFITGHFFARMGRTRFIIRDLKRSRAAISDGRTWYIAELDGDQTPFPKEDAYSGMWREYFEKMAIRERINEKLQRQFVPMRYRAHLTEFQNQNIIPRSM